MIFFSYFREKLWVKVMSAILLLLILVMGAMTVTSVLRQTGALKEQIKHDAEMLATAIEGGMIDSLAVGDNDAVIGQFRRLKEKMSDLEVMIYDFQRDISFATDQSLKGRSVDEILRDKSAVEIVDRMIETGKAPVDPLEESVNGKPFLSVLRPIHNATRCFHCHGSSRKVLGGILVRASSEKAMQAATDARNMNVLLGIAGLAVLALLVYSAFQRLVDRPLKGLVDLAGKMRQGDLSSVVEVKSRDEIGHVMNGMNLVNENLRKILGEIMTAAQTVSEATNEQSAALEETNSSLEEMGAMTKKNAENASHADQLMHEVVQVIEKANAFLARATHSMDAISEGGDEMSKIIRTIDEIAFQTNLLALNAAVEAARAGQAGAGFAVVADEVRNLAVRASEAAKGTSALIETTADKIHEGTSMVAETNKAFSEVSARATRVGDLLSEIDKASREQAQGIEQVSQAAMEIDEANQRNALNAEGLVLAVQTFKIDGQVDSERPSAGSGPVAAEPRDVKQIQ